MKKLLEQGTAIISSRTSWEAKQRAFYDMRHDGLRRRNKPFPTAADLHFPLIDMLIREWKPFWLSQVLGTEKLASFVALREQIKADTEAAADFFDFEVKERSNWEDEIDVVIDTMLLRGRGIMRSVVDPLDGYALKCESVDPVYLLMPATAHDFEDADHFIHVRPMTVAQYRRDRRYNQDEETIQRIKGSKDPNDLMDAELRLREGITHSTKESHIILWEHYTKTMGGWTVNTFCPQDPEAPVRKPFGIPYKTVDGKASLPYHSFVFERKDKGWYAPRGVAELAAPFEVYLCKTWNEKADGMTFGNRPLFTSDQDIPNTQNMRWNPGEFIPGNVKAVVMPQPAISFDQEMQATRGIAEQHQMMPDVGITNPSDQKNPRTATEMQRVGQLMNMGTEHNGRIFRRQLSKHFQHVWGLLVQYKRKDLSYYVSEELRTLPEQAIHNQYMVKPAGSPDQWNKQNRFQKALMRFQVFSQDPNVDREELVRETLNADDPRLAQKLFIPTNVKAASEAEDEAVEIMLLMQGFPAAVKPGEDHATRIQVLAGKMQQLATLGTPMDQAGAIALQRMTEHLQVHMQYLQQTQPEAFKALVQAVQQPQPMPGQPQEQPQLSIAQ